MAHGDNTGRAARGGHAACDGAAEALPPGKRLVGVRVRVRVGVRGLGGFITTRARVGRVSRRAGTPRPPAILRGIEARGVAE